MSGGPDNKPIKRVVARPIIKRRVQEATSPDDASKTDDVNSCLLYTSDAADE